MSARPPSDLAGRIAAARSSGMSDGEIADALGITSTELYAARAESLFGAGPLQAPPQSMTITAQRPSAPRGALWLLLLLVLLVSSD